MELCKRNIAFGVLRNKARKLKRGRRTDHYKPVHRDAPANVIILALLECFYFVLGLNNGRLKGSFYQSSVDAWQSFAIIKLKNMKQL